MDPNPNASSPAIGDSHRRSPKRGYRASGKISALSGRVDRRAIVRLEEPLVNGTGHIRNNESVLSRRDTSSGDLAKSSPFTLDSRYSKALIKILALQ